MRTMRVTNFIRWMLLLNSIVALIIFIGLWRFEFSASKEESSDAGFSCYTYDSQKEKIVGFWRQKDDTWYLFLPSTQSISDTLIYYTGNVTSVSAGKLHKNAKNVSHAVASSEDCVTFMMETGEKYDVMVMQSNLPSVQISLKGNLTLEEIHKDKTLQFEENTFVLKDFEEKYNLTLPNYMEIEGRGNTTWELYNKKSYQIKFKEEVSVLGMEPAKKWVLMANSSDDSMIRNQLVFQTAENLSMKYVPHFKYVDLWINGDYLGTYLLGEKVEIENSRLDLNESGGGLFEHDEGYYDESENVLFSKMLQKHFVLKDAVSDDPLILADAMKSFEISIDELMTYLYTTPSKNVTLNQLATMIDVDSFAKYYLINEYVLNKEAFVTSFYWYKDGEDDVLHLGPLWDFDTSMGNDGSGIDEKYGEDHPLFGYLLAIPEFQKRTEDLYFKYSKTFSDMKAMASVLEEEIQISAEMNYLRWDVLGGKNPKEHAEDYAGTFEEAINSVETWLEGRKNNFHIGNKATVNSRVSSDHKMLNIVFSDGNPYESVIFAVMNSEFDADDAKWYEAKWVDGNWQSTVDLMGYNVEGMYRIDVYVNDFCAVTTGCNYIPIPYQLTAELSEEQDVMYLKLKESELLDKVSFAVWSTESGQDDLQWFDGKRNAEGVWEYAVDMETFHAVGEYHIHSYGEKNNMVQMLNVRTIEVESTVD